MKERFPYGFIATRRRGRLICDDGAILIDNEEGVRTHNTILG